MKRFLLLVVGAALVLLVPMDAAAECGTMCASVFGPCVESTPDTACNDFGHCSENFCLGGSRPPRAQLLTSKYQIASVEIEYRSPADMRDGEIRVAAKTNPEPVKKISLE